MEHLGDEPAHLTPPPQRTVKVWDLPVRLCHWGFALLLPALWWTAENSEWAWHKICGLALLSLLVFRITWGFVGSRTARFVDFIRGPRSVLAYLRGEWPIRLGHSPLGAVGTVVLLLAMSLQVSFGLFAGDPFDGATGPLNPLVGVMTADMLTDWHETFFEVLLWLVGVHVAAIAFYAVVKRNDLVRPMINGRRLVADGIEGITPASTGKAAVVLLLSIGLVAWVAFGAPPLDQV
ncbi:MAG: cytochrome b/b6 domain-containing protein [Pseudomonadota bacterium]